MNAIKTKLASKISQACFNAADLQSIIRFAKRDEQGRAVIAARVEIVSQMYFGACIKIHRALLVSLAQYDALAPLEIDVSDVELYQLANAHAC